jgi:hypothetical protein
MDFMVGGLVVLGGLFFLVFCAVAASDAPCRSAIASISAVDPTRSGTGIVPFPTESGWHMTTC